MLVKHAKRSNILLEGAIPTEETTYRIHSRAAAIPETKESVQGHSQEIWVHQSERLHVELSKQQAKVGQRIHTCLQESQRCGGD